MSVGGGGGAARTRGVSFQIHTPAGTAHSSLIIRWRISLAAHYRGGEIERATIVPFFIVAIAHSGAGETESRRARCQSNCVFRTHTHVWRTEHTEA